MPAWAAGGAPALYPQLSFDAALQATSVLRARPWAPPPPPPPPPYSVQMCTLLPGQQCRSIRDLGMRTVPVLAKSLAPTTCTTCAACSRHAGLQPASNTEQQHESHNLLCAEHPASAGSTQHPRPPAAWSQIRTGKPVVRGSADSSSCGTRVVCSVVCPPAGASSWTWDPGCSCESKQRNHAGDRS
jgi:hypothetical protein